MLARGRTYSDGNVSVNFNPGAVTYWSPVFTVLTAIFGFLAYSKRESKWAQAYTIMLGIGLTAFVGVAVFLVVVIATVGGIGCSSVEDRDGRNTCASIAGGLIALLVAALACAIAYSFSCCFCGWKYYKGLRDEEEGMGGAVFVAGAPPMHQQGYIQQGQATMPYHHTAGPQMATQPQGDVPPVFNK